MTDRPTLPEAAKALLDCWDMFLSHDGWGNQADAYYNLAKGHAPQWEALRATLEAAQPAQAESTPSMLGMTPCPCCGDGTTPGHLPDCKVFHIRCVSDNMTEAEARAEWIRRAVSLPHRVDSGEGET